MEGVLSHQLKRFVIDGDQVREIASSHISNYVIQLRSLMIFFFFVCPKVIPNRLSGDEQVDQFQFQAGEVYTMDIVLSTGDGKVNLL